MEKQTTQTASKVVYALYQRMIEVQNDFKNFIENLPEGELYFRHSRQRYVAEISINDAVQGILWAYGELLPYEIEPNEDILSRREARSEYIKSMMENE